MTRMLAPFKFEDYCARLQLPDRGRKYLERVRSSPPSRRVASFVGNVVGRYASRKMGCTIQFESRHGELAVVYQFEHDAHVLEFYDQPEPIKLSYVAGSGRQTGAAHTPDFVVLRDNHVSWIEVKPEECLAELAVSQPNRFRSGVNGAWHCPPGEAVAAEHGFRYSIVSSTDINQTLVRNLSFLDDYSRGNGGDILKRERDSVSELIQQRPGISIAAVREQLGSGSMDALYTMILEGKVFFDLEAELLTNQELAYLYPDRVTAEALTIMRGACRCENDPNACASQGHQQTNAPPNSKTALEQPVRLPLAPTPVETSLHPAAEYPPAESAQRLIQGADPRDLAVANERYKIISDTELRKTIPARTLRRLLARVKKAEEIHGFGYLGLLPRRSQKGNSTPRLPARVYELAKTTIEQVFMTPKRVTKMHAYGTFSNQCEEEGLSAPSYAWFVKEIGKQKAYDLKLAREGKRAAYSMKQTNRPLSARNDSHGDFPWQVVHVDHTEADIELVDEGTGTNLGRPWLSLMFDAYSRKVLAFVLTFDPPSTNSLRLLLRDCVRRHSRLPSTLVLDGGKEFGSEFFEALTAMFEINILKRPPAQCRFGSVIEREFKTLNQQFFHNLAGNTQNTRNVRQLTKAVNPKGLAVWSLEALHALLSQFCYELHDKNPHSALGMSPADAYSKGLALSGARLARQVDYDEVFRFLTMATTPKGTAKVQPCLGVKIRYFYYWNEEMRDPQWEGKAVCVRYDLEDLGVAYAFIGSKWVKCISSHHDTLAGRSEKQLALAVQALRKVRSTVEQKRALTAKEIAKFFKSTEGDELVRTQRLKDQARRQIAERAANSVQDHASQPREAAPVPVTEVANFETAADVTGSPESETVYDDF